MSRSGKGPGRRRECRHADPAIREGTVLSLIPVLSPLPPIVRFPSTISDSDGARRLSWRCGRFLAAWDCRRPSHATDKFPRSPLVRDALERGLAAGNRRNDVYPSLSQKRYRTPDYANSVSAALHSTVSCEYTSYVYFGTQRNNKRAWSESHLSRLLIGYAISRTLLCGSLKQSIISSKSRNSWASGSPYIAFLAIWNVFIRLFPGIH